MQLLTLFSLGSTLQPVEMSLYDNVLDYGEGLGLAVGVVVGVTLVFIPLMHLIFYFQYFVKFWILYSIFGRKQVNIVELEESEQKNEVI